ncbi:MAG: YjjG family noncanonical pyrimidine nucleotidase [Schleiferiaceae bacterium]|nr:YjjG family noncanonical pyrimidine nucleotidase [Schleiferiaceae bacterium]
MKGKYRHLFFDLDHTLWDFEKNSEETLKELFEHYKLYTKVPSFEDFHATYIRVNNEKWAAYRAGILDKSTLRATRFLDTLAAFDAAEAPLAKALDEQYLSRSPYKTHLMPNTLATLDVLRSHFELHIITNGFVEVQRTKIENSGLQPYFSKRISSEEVGVNKPDPRIFSHALTLAGAGASESLMIGDNHEADVLGAAAVGMDQVWYRLQDSGKEEVATYIIADLAELVELLRH